ncbi:hypothetical protein BJX64DRAFT_291055 [Aspergillus heterothallicus]
MARKHSSKSHPRLLMGNKPSNPLPKGYFERLPFEIVEHVAKFMEFDTMLAFRSSSRLLRSAPKDFETFQQRFSDRRRASAIDTLAVSVKLQKEPPGRIIQMGGGIEWAWSSKALLDLQQPEVTTWVELLAKFDKLRHVRINVELDSAITMCEEYTQDPPEFSTRDAFLLTMHFITTSSLQLTSLRMLGAKFYQAVLYSQMTLYEWQRPIRTAIDSFFRNSTGTKSIGENLNSTTSASTSIWRNLESLDLDGRSMFSDDTTRFTNLLCGTTNLKRLTIQHLRDGHELRCLADWAKNHLKNLQELHLRHSALDELQDEQLYAALTNLRGTLRKLSLTQVQMWNWMPTLRFLCTGTLSQLREFSLANCTEPCVYTRNLYLPWDPHSPLFAAAPAGARVKYVVKVVQWVPLPTAPPPYACLSTIFEYEELIRRTCMVRARATARGHFYSSFTYSSPTLRLRDFFAHIVTKVLVIIPYSATPLLQGVDISSSVVSPGLVSSHIVYNHKFRPLPPA